MLKSCIICRLGIEPATWEGSEGSSSAVLKINVAHWSVFRVCTLYRIQICVQSTFVQVVCFQWTTGPFRRTYWPFQWKTGPFRDSIGLFQWKICPYQWTTGHFQWTTDFLKGQLHGLLCGQLDFFNGQLALLGGLLEFINEHRSFLCIIICPKTFFFLLLYCTKCNIGMTNT